MPRKNKLKREPVTHHGTIYDKNYSPKCHGCPFAGKDFVCTTSDGLCLKSKSERRGEEKGAVKK
jgi:hypothetical protein